MNGNSSYLHMSHGNRPSSKPVNIRPKGPSKANRLAELLTVLQEMTEKDFTGHIKINFSQGGIGRIEKYEEILRGTPSSD